MKSVKLAATNALGRLRGEAGQLWQPRFFDHALRTVQDYWEKVEYIHLNPVRRGLVARPEDWTWSSAAEYSGASPEEQRRRCGLVITGYDYQRRARPASDLRRLDAGANPTSRRPKSGVCATLFLALLGEVADEAIDLAVRCTKAGREIMWGLTVALATKLRGNPDNEYRLEWTEEAQVKSLFLVVSPSTWRLNAARACLTL